MKFLTWGGNISGGFLRSKVDQESRGDIAFNIELAELADQIGVDAIVLGNTLALEGGLNVLKDSVFREPIDQTTQLYVNLLGVSKANKDDPTYAKLGELYHLPQVQKFVTEKFAGTKVEVNKPVSEFADIK